MRGAALVVLAIGLGACAQVLGVGGVEIGENPGSGGATSATATASSSAKASSSAASGAGGGTMPPKEDCTNGKDDDGDNQIDCQDSDCAAYQCVMPAPMGWSGPTIAELGKADPCPNPAADDVKGGSGALTAPPPTCTPCTCGMPTCQAALRTFTTQLCGGSLQTINLIAPSQCMAPPQLMNALSFRSFDKMGGMGNALCTPMGGKMNAAAATFASDARVCAAPAGAGCATAAQVCAPKPPAAPWQQCVYAPGNIACPGAPTPYTQRTVVYQINDMRTCSPCQCSSNTVTCTGTIALYSDVNCTNKTTSVPQDGSQQCVNGTAGSLEYTPNPPMGTCNLAIGPSPSGTATATNPVTVCCAP